MHVTDPIADYLTRIRNAQMAGHKIVEIPASKIKKRLTEILYEQGFILKYTFDDAGHIQGLIKIAIKYDAGTKLPTIRKMQRVSRPGLRQYASATEIPRVINNLGIMIVSTSAGLMTGRQAREKGIGGELLCYIY
jgi:small subunit ribosomal protein S8